ncbi:MAG TPA: PaaI family thioesterase, partial [Myxococcota bacterium]|nr:PaaI family thioesterase [Myxococcota bacterium]
ARISPAEFLLLLRESIPLTEYYDFRIEAIGEGTAVMVLPPSPLHVRAGGTLSGPTLMTLADATLYAAVLGAVGPAALAVTSDLSFRFLRRPPLSTLRAEASLLARHSKLVVGQVLLYSEGVEEPVAQATGSYVLPARST